ncbi:MAG TPA: isoaspartyl peptidase/L-asparaginase [Chitinophagaceae bacterium]|nr:isoaspartyl peptidase/L-asparaginase [Chitinophagaceae bacterium]
MSKIAIAVHGGAGTILKEEMTPVLEKNYKEGLKEAMEAGYAVLEKQGSAVEAVRAAVVSLEDNILFNAGKGSVFANDGSQEMDAAIMDGSNLKAGAVAGVKNIRNPICLAEEIMKNSDHVFLCGNGALEFAKKQGLKFEPDEYFFSRFRYDQWQAVQHSDNYLLDHGSEPTSTLVKEKKFGTVGAVACDADGNVAAATSTGGMTNKKWGRIGDTPIIGSGNYANNKTAAISCTGHGEPFILAVAAYDVSCLMEYKGLSLHEAMEIVVNDKLRKLKGEGGMIGMDANGNGAMIFNSAGMYRGIKNSEGLNEIGIYK